jgi:hypothetical protein
MTKIQRIIVTAATVATVIGLTGCNIGRPMATIPEPESQLTGKAGLFTDDNGEWVIYRKQ